MKNVFYALVLRNNEADVVEFILVKIGEEWSFPGGEMKDDEVDFESLQNGLKDELPYLKYTYVNCLDTTTGITLESGVPVTVRVYHLKYKSSSTEINRKSITDSGWFTKETLPEGVSKKTEEIIIRFSRLL